jgi:cathepsin A (carboxypeptidase C)
MNGLIKRGHAYVLSTLYNVCQFSLVFNIPILSTVLCASTGASIATPGLPAFNIYDIREPCVEMGLCYPDDFLGQVMNSG